MIVIEEFIKCEYCLWEERENFDENTDVLKRRLVTPLKAEKEYLAKQTDI